MHRRLLAPFAALERRKRDFLARLCTLDDAQLGFRPAPGSWSLVDVADHLSKIEAQVAAGIVKGLPPGKDRRTLKHAVMLPIVLFTLALPVRVKVPGNAGGVTPEPGRSLAGVRADWEAHRAALAAALGALDDAGVERMVLRHPIAGPANARQTLAFLNAHFDHHRFQVDRIRQHPGFPKAAAGAA